MNRVTNLIKAIRRELKRRKVVRACVIYITACWGGFLVAEKASSLLGLDLVAAGIADKTFFFLGLDVASERDALLLVAFLGLIIMIVFSWFYQVSAGGIIRTPPFVDRRVLHNLAPLEDRRMDAPLHRKPSKHESAYDWILEMESGPLAGLRYGVEGNIVVGRSMGCEITIPVPLISREHAQFVLYESQLSVEDLDSSNGTAVNGSKISGTVNLNHLDTVEILNIIIRIKESLAHAQNHAHNTTIVHNAALHRRTEN